MVLKLVGSHGSTCSRRVKVVAYEKGIELEVQPVNFATAEHKSPAFLEKQPFGQVPYLDDDGFIVFESRAIARYIANKYADQGPKLIPEPTDFKAMALFEQAASIEQSNFDPFASGIGAQKVFHPMRGIPTDEKRVEELVTTLRGKLEGYERILSKQKYLAGDELTIVDLFHLPYGSMAEQFFPDLYTSHPHVGAWWNSLKERPSWKRAQEEMMAAMK